MSRITRGPRVLGLCALAVLGLVAFTASAAQASGSFIVLGSEKLFPVAVTGEAEGQSAFLVPSLKLEIICQKATIEGTLETGGHGKETMTFKECTVPKTPCEVDPIVAKFLSEVLLHAEGTWLKFTPQEGKSFTTIFLLGGECPLPKTNELSGAFVAKINAGEAKEQLLTFATDEATKKLFGVNYAFGVQPAILEMSSIWKLAGSHLGCSWGAV